MPLVDKVKVFASDDNLKILGELLSNDSSRRIMIQLMTEPMYVNELAAALDLRVSLVVHHLNKMKELGLLEYTLKKITKKGEKHKFLKISSDLFITVDKTKEEVKETGLLKRIFKDGIKFVAIGIAGSIVWLSDIANYSVLKEVYPVPFGQNIQTDPLIPALVIIITGLVIERIFSYKKKKREFC